MTLDELESRGLQARAVRDEAEAQRRREEQGRLDREWACCLAAFCKEFPDLAEYADRTRPEGFGHLTKYGEDVTIRCPDRETFAAQMKSDGQTWFFVKFTVPALFDDFDGEAVPSGGTYTADPCEALLLAREAVAKRLACEQGIRDRAAQAERNGHAPRVDCWTRLAEAVRACVAECLDAQTYATTEGQS